jgi:hypothetical protein
VQPSASSGTDHRSQLDLSFVNRAVDAWLREHADIAVRFLVAPPGFGKTTALAAYARSGSARRCLHVTIDARSTIESFARSLGSALGAGDTSASELRVRLAQSAPLELLLDDVHVGGSDLWAFIDELIAGLPRDVNVVVAAQRRDVLDVGTLFARGRVALCDQSQLAMTGADTRALFDAHGIVQPPAAIDALVARTNGWPPAIVGTARELVRERQSVEAAYRRWRGDSAVPAIDLVNSLLDRVPLAERAALRRSFADGSPLEQETLALLHRCGFFVTYTDGTFALMNWIAELFPAKTATRRELAPLDINLFGRFNAAIDGQPISWARRRDQHIMKYLALQADGSATRAELADVFWPQTARPLAMQNLRTACSTIRRAIGNVVGMERVDDYFIAGDRLILNRSTVTCDVERFRRLVRLADADDAAGATVQAITHFRAAEALYGNGLFAGDISEPVFFATARELAETYARILDRLSAELIVLGSPELARAYAAKAHKLGFFQRNRAAGANVNLRFVAS